jgi:Zn ribbon nucleic-acid-binding protein
MDKLWISERVSMLACRRCGYQVSVPSSIKTHGDLRKWSENVVLFKK